MRWRGVFHLGGSKRFAQVHQPIDHLATGSFQLTDLALLITDDLVEGFDQVFLIGQFGFDINQAVFAHGNLSIELLRKWLGQAARHPT